jgi:hypothetical protein
MAAKHQKRGDASQAQVKAGKSTNLRETAPPPSTRFANTHPSNVAETDSHFRPVSKSGSQVIKRKLLLSEFQKP